MLEDELIGFARNNPEVRAVYKEFDPEINRDIYHFFVENGFGGDILNFQMELREEKKMFFDFSVLPEPATHEMLGLKNCIYTRD